MAKLELKLNSQTRRLKKSAVLSILVFVVSVSSVLDSVQLPIWHLFSYPLVIISTVGPELCLFCHFSPQTSNFNKLLLNLLIFECFGPCTSKLMVDLRNFRDHYVSDA